LLGANYRSTDNLPVPYQCISSRQGYKTLVTQLYEAFTSLTQRIHLQNEGKLQQTRNKFVIMIIRW